MDAVVEPIFAYVKVPLVFGMPFSAVFYYAKNDPPWKGDGYIAGESPDGLVTFNGAGTIRTLDLWDRETNTCVASTESASDGTYRFDGVSTTRLFDVRARGIDATENDLIVAGVTAAT